MILILFYIFISIAIVIASIIAIKTLTSSNKDKTDDVPFSKLNWVYGGEDGSSAKLTDVRISNLILHGTNSMTMHWDVGMDSWGYARTEPSGMACLFCKVDNQWVGGKFEWISTSRNNREFTNIKKRYVGWQPSCLNATEFAFVVITADRKKRSNVTYFKR